MLNIVGAGLRAFLLLCGAVVLGLSVTLAKQQVNGSPPSETSFSSFAGAFGIIAAAVGLAAIFVEAIPRLVSMAIEALAAVFFLAGGIAMAVAIKGISCTSNDPLDAAYRLINKLISGGCVEANNRTICGIFSDDANAADTEAKARCTRVEADLAFEFIACVFFVGALLISFLSSRNRATHY